MKNDDYLKKHPTYICISVGAKSFNLNQFSLRRDFYLTMNNVHFNKTDESCRCHVSRHVTVTCGGDLIVFCQCDL